MRQGPSSRRQRGRNSGRRNNSQQRNQVYDSNGPDVRIRGTAHQVAEKYLSLAKDASASGDIVVAENYYQHAEHYIRIIGEQNGNFDANKVLGYNDGGNVNDQGHNQNQEQNSSQQKHASKSGDETSKPAAKQNNKEAAEEMAD